MTDDATSTAISSTARRTFLQQSALLLGTSLLVQPHRSFAQVPTNAAELDSQDFRHRRWRPTASRFTPWSAVKDHPCCCCMARRSRIFPGHRWR